MNGLGTPGALPWALAVLAVAVRAVHLLAALDDPSAFQPLVDADTYHNLAIAFSQEGRFDETFLWQASFYPLFLSAVYKVFGVSVLAAKLVQILLAGATCLLTVRLGRRLFGDPAGLLAGLVVALYGPLAFFDLQLLATGWTAFWAVALTSLAVAMGDRPRALTFFGFGAVGALAILTRPTFVPVVAALLIWALWSRRRDPAGRAAALRGVGIAALALLVILGPYALVMQGTTGHTGVIPPSGGINLHIGNNPDYARTINIRPGLAWDKLIDEPRSHGHRRGPWHGRPYFTGKVREFVTEHPGQFLGLLGRKTLQLVSSRELPRNLDIHVHRAWSNVLSASVFRIGSWGFPFGVLLPLAAVGLWRGGARSAVPLLIVLLVFGASLVLVFVSTRYRTPLVPLLAVLAGHGLVQLRILMRERNTRALAVAAVLVLAVTIVGTVPGPFAQESADLGAELHYGIGWNYFNDESWDLAEHHLRRAVELDPDMPTAHNFLGLTLVGLDGLDEAAGHFAEAVRLEPDYVQAANNLAVCRAKLADFHYRRALEVEKDDQAAAVADLVRAVGHKPDWPNPLLRLAWLRASARADSLRDGEEALLLIRSGPLRAIGTDPSVGLVEAAALAEMGRFDAAVIAAEAARSTAAAKGQTDVVVQLDLALVAYRAGRPWRP